MEARCSRDFLVLLSCKDAGMKNGKWEPKEGAETVDEGEYS